MSCSYECVLTERRAEKLYRVASRRAPSSRCGASMKMKCTYKGNTLIQSTFSPPSSPQVKRIRTIDHRCIVARRVSSVHLCSISQTRDISVLTFRQRVQQAHEIQPIIIINIPTGEQERERARNRLMFSQRRREHPGSTKRSRRGVVVLLIVGREIERGVVGCARVKVVDVRSGKEVERLSGRVERWWCGRDRRRCRSVRSPLEHKRCVGGR